ncbi:MAG: tetratricopeptide repeat protein [Armatimonadetes bacterium]|nr:tetratricopeptide repeat protein [Armatimonadota bacterium]
MWQVPSLEVPPLQWITAREKEMTALLEYSAVQLFVERAKQVDPNFRVNGANALAAAQICMRLDGIPLGIELAAARVSLLSAPQILERLDNRFRLLTGGNRTSLPRQQTLRALIDWSYDLLNAQERELLQRLSVFSGGWTFEAAEQIGSSERIEDWEVLELLSELIAKSLVMAETRKGERRFRLLETVRQYALDRLLECGENATVRARHRDYFLKFAEETAPKLNGTEQLECFYRLDMEYDNLRSGLGWSLEESDGLFSLRFCGALNWYWWTRGLYAEGRLWCERTLALSFGNELIKECIQGWSRTMNAAGSYSSAQGEHATSWGYHEECLKICREVNYLPGIAQTLRELASMAELEGDFDQARGYYQEARVIYQEIGSPFGVACALLSLGRLDKAQGDYQAAKVSLEACSNAFRALGNLHTAAHSLSSLGGIALIQGDYAAAKTCFEESLSVFRGVSDQGCVASSLGNLGNLALYQGDFAVARAYFEEKL